MLQKCACAAPQSSGSCRPVRYRVATARPLPAATSSSSSRIARWAAGSASDRSGKLPYTINVVSAAPARPTPLMNVPKAQPQILASYT
jgi:hypothetical protein